MMGIEKREIHAAVQNNFLEGTAACIISSTQLSAEVSTKRNCFMNTIPAHDLKRRGIAAVDDLIAKGDLYVIRNNQPQYVVLSTARYQELLEAQAEAHTARIRASLEDLKAGRVQRFASAAELLTALDDEDDE
jgi:PHD/YefM family antitoxin component YafN of YafNO toxin-antitoxin module